MNYKDILQNILNNGQPKQPVRFDSNNNPVPVENGTIGTFCEIFRHDMSKGFPLTALRRMPYKSMSVELEGFIKGITDKRWYQERGSKFWDEWSNPVAAKELFDRSEPSGKVPYNKENQKQAQELCDDLGPIYGYQWRNFGKHYGEIDFYPSEWQTEPNGSYWGQDQLKSIVDKLKTNPYDRRMICSAWNPNQVHMMSLPACHVLWHVVVYGNNLNLTWFQRSCDGSHGVPNNIASYALLLLLLCEESGLEPGELVGVLSDCHLYTNTIDSVKILLEREEKELPQLKIKRKPDNSFSIFDWTYKDMELINYNPHPKLNMGAVTV